MSDQGDGRLFLQIFESSGYLNVRADFAAGSFGNRQESMELSATTALEALGDIRRNGDGRSMQLIAQAEISTEGLVTRNAISLDYEIHPALPRDKIFIPSNASHL